MPKKPDRDDYQRIIIDVFKDMDTGMAVSEAFYTILAAAVVADQEILDVEEEEREALVHRSRTLSDMRRDKPHDLEQIKRAVNDRLKDFSRLPFLVDDAAAAIRNAAAKDEKMRAMPYSVFAHACDIVFADSKVVAKERDFLAKLADALQLPQAQMQEILEFIRRKNEF